MECGQIATGAHFATSSGAVTFSTTTVRSGSRSLRIESTASAAFVTTTIGAANTIVGRVYVRFEVLPVTTGLLVMCNDSAAPAIYYSSVSNAFFSAVGSSPGASGVTVTTGQWYRLDYKWVVNTAGTDTCDLQVDGVACAQMTGTGVSVTPTDHRLRCVGNGSIAFYDDWIISNTAADYPLGGGYVNHFVPTSDGTHNIAGTADFRKTLTATDILNATTDAYQLVDDVPLESGASVDWINMLAPVNATDYVECVFGPAPGISTPTNPPRAVEAIAAIHQAATTTGNMEIRLNDNGTMGTVYTATAVAGVTSVAYKRAHFADPPSAATAWVIGGGGNGDFTDLRVRFGSPAVLDVVPDQYFDCIMLEAEFAEVAVAALPPKSYVYNHGVHRASRW